MTDQQAIHYLEYGSEKERKKAFIYIKREFSPMYFSILRKRGIKDTKEEILHESIVILYQKIHERDFKLTSKLTTYLYSVCDKLALAHHRERGKKNNRKSIDEITEEVLRKMDEESKILRPSIRQDSDVEWYDQIREEVQNLGSPCQDILFAFYFHQKRLKEIAKEMGYASENAAKQRKYGCIERLKRQSKHLFTV